MNNNTVKEIFCKGLLMVLATAGLMLLCGAAEGTVLPVLALAGEVLILMGIKILLEHLGFLEWLPF